MGPCDPEKPTVTSGIRLGTPACTSRGFGAPSSSAWATVVDAVLDGLAAKGEAGDPAVEEAARPARPGLTQRFPIYG